MPRLPEGSRAAHLAALASPVDVVVIGGGITGAGVALEAAAHGYRVALLEQADFAGGTSSRSTKLVHGGIRYLARGQVGLVREALRQRSELLRAAPHLVHPLAFVIPLYPDMTRPLGVRVPPIFRSLTPMGVRVGLWSYDMLAGDAAMRHGSLTAPEAAALVPALRTESMQAAYLYYDARTDDVRLTHAVLAAARRHGAATVNYARVHGLLRDGPRVAGVRFEDRLNGQTYELRARRVVNASGVWAERVAELDSPPAFRIAPSKGVHLVLRPAAMTLHAALIIPETDDGRLAFLVPWIGGRVVLGTTDTRYSGPLEMPTVQPADVTYLLDHANRYLTTALVPRDVVGAYAGLRPLIAAREGSSATLSREHAVVTAPSGFVSIIGGKLTSFRKMARDVLDALDGNDGDVRSTDVPIMYDFDDLPVTRERLAASSLPADKQRYLLESYGTVLTQILSIGAQEPELLHPLVDDLPVLAAEVVYACRAEMAVSLTDVMFLRSRVSVLAADGGRSAVERVAALMARELDWDAAELIRQRESWEAALEHERAGLDNHTGGRRAWQMSG